MCLKVRVEVVGLTEQDAEEVALAIEAKVPIEFNFEEANPARPSVTLSISEPRGGCGCSLLRRKGSWKAPFWNFKKAVLPHIAEAVAKLEQGKLRVVRFDGQWLGPSKPKPSEVTVSLPQLLQRIRECKIKPGAKYIVDAGA
jgi:hypothetical protein